MNEATISSEDLDTILSTHGGNCIFQQTLQQIRNPRELLHVLSQYIDFSSLFGGGILVLAGNVDARQDLFRDSREVAAEILSASIDEFIDSATPEKSDHRQLAQATLIASGVFFGYDTDSVGFNELTHPSKHTLAAKDKIRDGYGIQQIIDEQRIFRAIGFHLFAEYLANKEFRILYNFLNERHPQLVHHLKGIEIVLGGKKHPAYYWVEAHAKTLEEEHVAASLSAANKAIGNYIGQTALLTVKGWIFDGMNSYAQVQTEFMRNLMS